MSLVDGSSSRTHPDRDAVSGKFLPGNRTDYHVRFDRLRASLDALKSEYEANNDAKCLFLAQAALHLDAAATARTSTKRTREGRLALKFLALVPRKERRQSLAAFDDVFTED